MVSRHASSLGTDPPVCNIAHNGRVPAVTERVNPPSIQTDYVERLRSVSSSITAYTYRPRASSVVGTWFVSGSAVVVCLLMTKFSRDSDRSSRG